MSQVARTILQQLGGNGFIAMTGAHTLLSHENKRGGLSLKFKGSRKANYLEVTLDHSDTYDLRFCQIGRNFNVKEVEQIDGVYCDMLQDIFKRVTGLDTQMPRIVGFNA